MAKNSQNLKQARDENIYSSPWHVYITKETIKNIAWIGYFLKKLKIELPRVYICSVAQSCPTLCNPMDYSLPGSSGHGILQARILEWVVISSPWGSSQPRDWTLVSCIFCVGRWVLYHWAIWDSQSYRVLCLVAQSCLTLHNPWTVALPALLSMRTLQARAIIWSNNSTYPKELKTPAQKDMCTPMFTAAFLQ